MTAEALKGVPEPTLRRLPQYLHYLIEIQKAGRPVVSAGHIGRELHLDQTQVRKDLAVTGIVGRPKVGYETDALIGAIRDFLGWNNTKDAFLVGVGHLGAALLGHDRFDKCGVRIVAAFDKHPQRVGTAINGRDVLPIEKLSDLAHRLHVHVGIITAPAEAAQTIADQMISGGIRAIWNFAPTTLDVPEDIIVQNEDLYTGLAVLSNRLVEALKTVPS